LQASSLTKPPEIFTTQSRLCEIGNLSIAGFRIARPSRSPRVQQGRSLKAKGEGRKAKVKPISELSPFPFRLDTLESALAHARASAIAFNKKNDECNFVVFFIESSSV
jgi:hypothetical protein